MQSTLDSRSGARASNEMPLRPKQDLRAWLAKMDAAGELKSIKGAERESEIGGIVDIFQRTPKSPAVLFDEVPGYPAGYRVCANILTSVRRINLTIGLPENASEMDLVRFWRTYMKEAKTIPPLTVESGPLMQNSYSGADVDLLKIPTPRWHEHDGGYYIGTGCMVIMKDPDSGWINYGAYRIQVHDRNVASVMTSKGKHGNIIMRKWHERGEPCPIAVVIGMHPGLFMVAGIEIPYGKNEYDAAGGLIGEPVEIITGPKTGLPIPAHAEAAFEGFVHPKDLIDEGPLGEWTGYYAGGLKKEPKIRVESFFHRDQPILLGANSCDAAERRHLLSRHLSVRRRVEPARGGGRARGEGRVVARGRRQPHVAHGIDQADVWRPRQAGRADRLAVPRGRLCEPLGGGGRRRHRPGQHEPGDLGDVHAFRSARGHGGDPRRMEHGARPHGLQPRRPAQRSRHHRRLPPVVAPRYLPDRGAFE